MALVIALAILVMTLLSIGLCLLFLVGLAIEAPWLVLFYVPVMIVGWRSVVPSVPKDGGIRLHREKLFKPLKLRILAPLVLQGRQRQFVRAVAEMDEAWLGALAQERSLDGQAAALVLASFMVERQELAGARVMLDRALDGRDVGRHPVLRRLRHLDGRFQFAGPNRVQLDMFYGREMALALAGRLALVRGDYAEAVAYSSKLVGRHPLTQSLRDEARGALETFG